MILSAVQKKMTSEMCPLTCHYLVIGGIGFLCKRYNLMNGSKGAVPTKVKECIENKEVV